MHKGQVIIFIKDFNKGFPIAGHVKFPPPCGVQSFDRPWRVKRIKTVNHRIKIRGIIIKANEDKPAMFPDVVVDKPVIRFAKA